MNVDSINDDGNQVVESKASEDAEDLGRARRERALSSFERTCSTVLHQSHLVPLPSFSHPVMWDYDQAMWLHPVRYFSPQIPSSDHDPFLLSLLLILLCSSNSSSGFLLIRSSLFVCLFPGALGVGLRRSLSLVFSLSTSVRVESRKSCCGRRKG